MTKFSAKDIERTAHLARLQFSETDRQALEQNLSNILSFAEKINEVDTDAIDPIAHPLELTLTMREDQALETNQRNTFQSLAPAVEGGLYLVPQVIE